MSITVAEKEHWKERIARRIDQSIEKLVAEKEPSLLQRVSREARAKAYESLGIGAQQRELDEIETHREQLERRKARLITEQAGIVKGTNVEAELHSRVGVYPYPDSAVAKAVQARAAVAESEILAASDLGREILALRVEKENLLDTVWLATSTSQIKELWSQVNSLLKLSPSPLEEKALKIEPVQEQ